MPQFLLVMCSLAHTSKLGKEFFGIRARTPELCGGATLLVSLNAMPLYQKEEQTHLSVTNRATHLCNMQRRG